MSDLHAPQSSHAHSSGPQPPLSGVAVRHGRWYDPLRRRWSGLLGTRRELTHIQHGDTYNTNNVNQAPVTTIHHADNVNVRLVAEEDIALFESLPKQPDISGRWNDYMEGSRTKDVKDICSWVDSEAASGLLWIHAAAGLGKSTLARQLKHRLHSQNRLGAAIFLSQLPTDSLGPETVIQLIGGELGRTHRGAVPAIAAAIRQSHGASVQVQLETYLHKPIISLGLPHPLVVIFDAVDEWRSNYHLISELGHLTSHTSLIRFVVLSRSEPRERLYKNLLIQSYPLQPVTVEVMQEYLNARFESIEWEFGRKPPANEIGRLAYMANGLFVWLSIVCSLLERSPSSPQDTLTAILHSRFTIGDTNLQLATLYSKAIGQLFPEQEEKEMLRTFLGYLMVLQEPLPLDAFSQLSGVSIYSLKRLAAPLKALQIRRPADSGVIVHPASNLFHASFLEYLQSTATPPDIAFPISSTASHSRLGEACLKMLTSLPTSLDLDNLYLPPAQKYSVLYWPWHISKGLLSIQPGAIEQDEMLQGSLLRSEGGLMLLRQWAPVFARSLQLDVISDLPRGESVNALLRNAACLVGATQASVAVFKIPCIEIAVHLMPKDADGWHELGSAYDDQAEVDDSLEYVQRSVASHQRSVDVTEGYKDEENAYYQHSLAQSLWLRFERTGDVEDLSRTLCLERMVLSYWPKGHPDRPMSLNNLARSLRSRFEQSGAVGDLDEAILLHRDALPLHPSGHPDRPWSLNNLASSLHSRFKQSGAVGDLDEAILLHRDALALSPSGHPDRPSSLNNLANSLRSRFQQSGAVGDLDEAIVMHRDALALRPSGHPDRPSSLSNLAASLQSRFEQFGAVGDLDEAIVMHRDALALRPSGHPDRPSSLSNLAASLHSRFQQSGALCDLDEAILLHRDALPLHPSGHPDRPSSLNNLASSLHSRFKQSGAVGDLDEAILLHRDALALSPSGHPDRPSSLNNLANSLRSRFQQSGAVGDLDEAIVMHRDALALRPSGHPDRPSFLNNLVASLQSHFEQSGAMGDIDEAIMLNRGALSLRPSGHPGRPSSLSNLALSLQSRFEQSGVVGDLDEAILLHRDALALCPSGHPDRPSSLNNLATSLQSRFEQSGAVGDLDKAILLHRDALALRPSGHPVRPLSLSNLAISLRSRFEQSGAACVLDEAIILQQEALSLRPSGHPRRPSTLWNLRVYLYDRFKLNRNGTLDDIREAVSLAEEELSLYTPDNPNRGQVLEWLSLHVDS